MILEVLATIATEDAALARDFSIILNIFELIQQFLVAGLHVLHRALPPQEEPLLFDGEGI